MLKVQCPRCKHDMLTNPDLRNPADLKKKVKQCVYCGHSFRIYKAIHDHQIKK